MYPSSLAAQLCSHQPGCQSDQSRSAHLCLAKIPSAAFSVQNRLLIECCVAVVCHRQAERASCRDALRSQSDAVRRRRLSWRGWHLCKSSKQQGSRPRISRIFVLESRLRWRNRRRRIWLLHAGRGPLPHVRSPGGDPGRRARVAPVRQNSDRPPQCCRSTAPPWIRCARVMTAPL